MSRPWNPFLAALSVAVCCTTTSVAAAWAAGSSDFTARAFIASGSNDLPDFKSELVNSGNGNPFQVAANQSGTPRGTYSGVLISPNRGGFRGLQTVSFATDSACSADARSYRPTLAIEYTTTGGHITDTLAPCSSAEIGEKNGNGFSTLTFNAAKLGITPQSIIYKIAIIGSSDHQKGKFLADDICVNGVGVDKSLTMGTLFYKVTNGSATGPLGQLGKPVAVSSVAAPRSRKALGVAASGGSGGRTELKLTNSSGSEVECFLTVGAVPNCVNDIRQYPFVTKVLNDKQGSFKLASGASISYTPPGNMGVSGNFSFGAPPNNCPPDQYPNGIDLAEFIVDNGFQGAGAQETLDISSVDGCNARIRFSMTGGQAWNAGSTKPNIAQFENKGLYENCGLVGVFPYACDNCTTSDAPPKCTKQPPKGKCQAEHICNVQRNAQDSSGGTVQVTFLGML